MTVRAETGIDFRGPLEISGSAGAVGQAPISQGIGQPPIWMDVQGLTFNPEVITYAATVNLDLAALTGLYRRINLTGPLTLTTGNLAAGRFVTLILTCDDTTRALAVPAGWRWSNKPTQIAASKWAALSLTFLGETDSDCIAAYWVQS
jgi:hypothetical protein